MNPKESKITGVFCGYRVEEIEDKLMQKVRYPDKLVDELAKDNKTESHNIGFELTTFKSRYDETDISNRIDIYTFQL